MSSLAECSNLGHQHPRLVAAIREQAQHLCFVTNAWGAKPRADLAQQLTLLSLCVFPLYILCMRTFGRQSKLASRQVQEAMEEFSGDLQERVAEVAFTLDFPIPPGMAPAEAARRPASGAAPTRRPRRYTATCVKPALRSLSWSARGDSAPR